MKNFVLKNFFSILNNFVDNLNHIIKIVFDYACSLGNIQVTIILYNKLKENYWDIKWRMASSQKDNAYPELISRKIT